MAKKFTLSVVFDMIDKATQPIKKVGKGIAKLTAPLKRVTTAFKRLTIAAINNKFVTSFKSAGRLIGRAAIGIGRSIIKLGKITAVAFAAASAAVFKFAGTADRIGKTASKLGITTDVLQELRFAAEQTGVKTETLDMAFQRFTRRSAEAAQGMGEALPAFQQLGISLKDNEGRLKTSEALFLEVADGIAAVENESEKVRLSFKFFDSEGVALANTMKGGSKQIKEFAKQAHEMGLIIDKDTIASSEKLNDSLNILKKVVFANFGNLISGLLPKIEKITMNISKWIGANKGLIKAGLIKFVDTLKRVMGPVVQNFSDMFIVIKRIIGPTDDLGSKIEFLIIFLAHLTKVFSAVAAGAIIAVVATFKALGAILGVVSDQLIRIGDVGLAQWAIEISLALNKILGTVTSAAWDFGKQWWQDFKNGFLVGLKEVTAFVGEKIKSFSSSIAGAFKDVFVGGGSNEGLPADPARARAFQSAQPLNISQPSMNINNRVGGEVRVILQGEGAKGARIKKITNTGNTDVNISAGAHAFG